MSRAEDFIFEHPWWALLIVLLSLFLLLGWVGVEGDERCGQYKDLPIQEVPADCYMHFAPSRVYPAPVVIPMRL